MFASIHFTSMLNNRIIKQLIRQQLLAHGFDLHMVVGRETLAEPFIIHFIGLRWHPPEREWDWPDGGQPEWGCRPAEKHQLISGAQSPGDESMRSPGGVGLPVTPWGHAGDLWKQWVVTFLGYVAGPATVSLQILPSCWRGVGGMFCIFWHFFLLAWFIALTS